MAIPSMKPGKAELTRSTKPGKAELTRNRILDAAAVLFCESGYASVTLRKIASAAGMKAGSVYYHFDSKDEIVIEVLNVGIELVHRKVDAAFKAHPGTIEASRLVRTCVASHLDALLQFSAYTSANVRIFGQVPYDVQCANLAARKRYEGLWEKILAQASRQGEIRDSVNLAAFRLLLIGSLNATLEWFDPAKGDVGNLADQYADILLNGLLSTREAAP